MTGVSLRLRQRHLVPVVVAVLSSAMLGFAPQACAAGPGYFSPTGFMSVSRSEAVVAPLPDGRALVAGGCCGPTAPFDLSSAEVFNPATGTFSPTGPMTVGRTGAVAAPLPDGRVLVAGGSTSGSEVLSSAEIFNLATGAFSPTGPMTTPRVDAAAAPLPDGRVLVAGGYDGTSHQFVSSAEVFNPATNTFSSAGIGSMSVPRYRAVAAPLPDGRVLVAGGEFPGQSGRDPGVVYSSAEVFDPATNRFSSAGIGSMSTPRAEAVAAPLPDGRVLVAGGYDLASAEVFDPATNGFSSAGIGSMSTPRGGAVAAPLPDGVLVGGGLGLSSAEVFALATGKRAAGFKRCKKQAHRRHWSHKRLRKCRRKAIRLPV
jgi:hypothetical protein